MIPFPRSAMALSVGALAAVAVQTVLTLLVFAAFTTAMPPFSVSAGMLVAFAGSALAQAFLFWLLNAAIVLAILAFRPGMRANLASVTRACFFFGLTMGIVGKPWGPGLLVLAVGLAICCGTWVGVYWKVVAPHLPGGPAPSSQPADDGQLALPLEPATTAVTLVQAPRAQVKEPAYVPVSDDNPALKRFIQAG